MGVKTSFICCKKVSFFEVLVKKDSVVKLDSPKQRQRKRKPFKAKMVSIPGIDTFIAGDTFPLFRDFSKSPIG